MKKTLALWLCLAALIAACAPAGLPSTPAPTSAAVTSPDRQPTMTAASPASAPTLAEATSIPVQPSAAPVRDEFVANDPVTVNLALGRPQFVEFFAFY